MFQRTADRPRGDMFEVSDQGDLRRQLEGGLEVLEAASERYRTLSATLKKRGWKAKLRLQPALLEEAVQQEPAVREALAALKRRAERGAERAEELLRKLERERDALSADIDRRLPVDALPELVQRIEWLKAQVLRPLPLPPGEGERRLLEGNSTLLPLSVFMLLLTLAPLVGFLAGPWAVAALMALIAAFTVLRSGRYWLTSERVLWQPRSGDPVQVSLATIGEGQLSYNPWTSSITVGLPGVTLRHLSRAGELAALLSIRRRKEFRSAAAALDPKRLVAVLPAYRTRPGEYRDPEAGPDGWLVLRPGFIVFLHSMPAARLLDAITEPAGPTRQPAWRSRDPVPVSMRQLVDQLLLLPEADMDRMLRQAARSRVDDFHWPFLLWEPAEVECRFAVSRSLELIQGDIMLYWDQLSWKEHQEAGRVINLWPRK